MKSSGPVFTRQNPFKPASKVGKSHYQPSCNQSLSKKKKKTTLSPVRSNQPSSPKSRTHTHPESQRPLKQHSAATDGQPVFAESWPSTECGSSSSDLETPEQSARAGKPTVSSERGVQQDSVLAKYIDRFRHGRPQSREERRQMPSATGEEQLPFWWMTPSSLPRSSTPTKTTDKDVIQLLKEDHGPAVFSPAGQRRRDGSLSPCRGSVSDYWVCTLPCFMPALPEHPGSRVSAEETPYTNEILSDASQGEFDDSEILHLQEKASRLLLKGEFPLDDGSIPVSSEGLECSDFSSPVSVDEPVRRPLVPSLIRSTAKASSDLVQASSQNPSVIPPMVPPTRREEDILFQWRLRRKMEQARSQSLQHSGVSGPTFGWQVPTLNHPSTSGQAYKEHQNPQPPEFSTNPTIPPPRPPTKEAHRSHPPSSDPPPFPAFAVSGSSVSQPQAVAHVPAHMHLLCDVLPCPIQASRASTQPHISESIYESQTKVPGSSMTTFTEPIREYLPPPPPASREAAERVIHHKRSERNTKEKTESEKDEKKTAPSFRKQKKSTRYTVERGHADGPANKSSSHQRVSKRVTPRAEQQQQEGSQGFSSESCPADHAPPSSPIHSALEQVVAEVLFPTVDSSPAQMTPVSSVSPPPCATSPPPQPSLPPCNAQNSMEVISQLLQEAEDSDEKEFEDDPLLQVLRKQRRWVKEQISEVDSVLNEFLEELHVT